MSLHHSPRIVTDGLILYLDGLNRKSYPGSGTQWRDLSGLGNHSTLVNGPVYDSATGIFTFTGDHVVTPLTLPVSEFTVSLSYKSLPMYGWRPVWSSEVWYSGTGYLVFFGDVDQLNFVRGGGGGGGVTIITPAMQMAVYTFSLSDANVASVYVNGQLASSGTLVAASSVDQPIKLSTRNSNDGAGLTDITSSDIGSLSVYNRVLTPTEVLRNFNAMRSRYGL